MHIETHTKPDAKSKSGNGLRFLITACLLIAGCAVGPDYIRPSVEIPPAYKETVNWKQAQS
ncbi:MAG TPA: hypothetical protein VHO84_04695, partial [Syntrophorhabdaceae bacterium]|nr:hypothetical protein [Syntrophorhabdaceae bacterium]